MNGLCPFTNIEPSTGYVKCEEIDKRVLHHRTLGARVTDKQTRDGIQQLVTALEAEKENASSRAAAKVKPLAPKQDACEQHY
jgi:hypothetical protein